MTSLDFGALGVPYPLIETLARDGKTAAFPIQAETLPDSLNGRDVLGRGRTGSGKTLAFSIPMVARLGSRLSGGPRRAGLPIGLILAPTRELATQIDATLAPLAHAYGLTTTTIFGGVSAQRQISALRSGVDIVVACPGRLEDLMKQGALRLDAVEITVLDEADHMADLGFLPGVTRILSATPAGGQRLLFSATLDNGVDRLVRQFLTNPVRHELDEIDAPAPDMTHHLLAPEGVAEKKELVRALASGRSRRILFMRTKHHAKRLARELTASGIPALDLHGNLSQAARDRNLAAFARGDVNVLVATDVAARGVHVDGIELVVHVDPPTEHKAYLHRSGRTARAGHAGDVVTVVLPEQERDVAAIMRKAGISAALQRVTATDAVVSDLVGEVAERRMPAPVSTTAAPASRGGRRSPRGGAQAAGAQRSGGQRGSTQRAGETRAGSQERPAGQRAAAGATRTAGARTASAATPTSTGRGSTRTRGASQPRRAQASGR